MTTVDDTYARALEHHAHHFGMTLDRNQSREAREFHQSEVKRAEGVILELFDLEGD